MLRIPTTASLSILALCLAGCAGQALFPERFLPEHSYHRMLEALHTDGGTGGISKHVMEAQERRFRAVRNAYEKQMLKTGEDFLWSGAIVLVSDEVSDLELAHELGEEANRLGEPRGLMVAANAIDLLAIKHGRPQKYGTQMRFEPVLGVWKLHNLDPRTTDEERQRMGLPTLAEQRAMVDEMNQKAVTERVRARLQISTL